MQEKSRLLQAGQTRNRSKSPVHHILLAVTLVLLCCIAVPQNVHASRESTLVDMGKKSNLTIGMTYYEKGTLNRNYCAIFSTLIGDARYAFVTEYMKEHPNAGPYAPYTAFSKELKKLKFKNTKPSVLKASVNSGGISIELKKTGKTTITVKGKLWKTTLNMKIIVNVYKYERPFTSFKINGKSYSNAFKDYKFFDIPKWDQSTRALKLQLKPKKGWVLQGVEYEEKLYPYWKIAKKSSTALNYKLIIPDENRITSTACSFKLYNKKEKQTIDYTIQIPSR